MCLLVNGNNSEAVLFGENTKVSVHLGSDIQPEVYEITILSVSPFVCHLITLYKISIDL
jgi:hypothetical protein